MLESLMFQTSFAQKATAHAKAGSAARKMVFGFINGLNSAPGFSCRSYPLRNLLDTFRVTHSRGRPMVRLRRPEFTLTGFHLTQLIMKRKSCGAGTLARGRSPWPAYLEGGRGRPPPSRGTAPHVSRRISS